MALETLDIRVRQQGARTVARDVRSIGFAASAATGQLSTTSKILRTFALAAVTRRVFAFADSFTNLNNRVRIFADNTEQANKTSRALIDIANRARVATDAVSLTYQRLAINQERLGLTTERVLHLTELLSKSVALGGSNAQEAGGALRQFSQGLASDFRSSAQELNSVLEQTPGLAKALADGLGTTTDQIKRLAKEGRLSSRIVIQAIESQAEVIEAKFSKIQPTIGQAFQVFTNSIEVFVGQVFRASDAGKKITGTLISFGKRLLLLASDEDRLNEVIDKTVTALKILVGIRVVNLIFEYAHAMDKAVESTELFLKLKTAAAFHTVATGAIAGAHGAETAAIAVGTLGDAVYEASTASRAAGGIFSRIFGGLKKSIIGIPALIAAVLKGILSLGKALITFVVTNPFLVLVGAALALVGVIYGLRDELVQVDGQTVRVRDLAVATFEVIKEKVTAAVNRVKDFTVSIFEVVGGLRGLLNGFVATFTVMGRIIGEVFGALVLDAEQAFDFVSKGFDKITLALKEAFKGNFKGAFKTLLEPLPGEFESAFKQVDIGKIVREEFGRDFLQEFVDTVFGGTEIADRAKELFAKFKKEQEAATKTGGVPKAPIRSTTFLLNDQQEEVAKLIAKFDIATEVALDFMDAQNKLRKAVEQNVISQKEQVQLLEQFGKDKFRRLAADTDEVAAATIKYNDTLAELNALAATAGLTGTPELIAAQQRLRSEFQHSLTDMQRWQESLSGSESFLKGIRVGIDRFADGIGTIFSNIADATESLLDRGIDAITKFTTEGTFDFRQFALESIAEIQKVILRLLALTAIRAGQKAAVGEGTFLGNFFGASGTPVEPGRGAAANATTGGGGLTDIFKEILAGGRRGEGAVGPKGVAADPLFVRIVNSTDIAGQTASPITEAINGAKEDSAAQQADQAVQQAGFFDGLATKIGDFFSGAFDKVGNLFSGGFSSLLGGLGSIGSLLQNGFSSLVGGISSALSGIAGAFTGGGGGGAGSSVLGLVSGIIGLAGGFQAGGDVRPSDLGKTFLVGEKGVELFKPKQTGTVIPNDQLAAAAGQQQSAPPVNVQVVNVDDPGSIPRAMSTKEGEQVILNVIQRNRGRLRQMIA